jgi:large subunit ribosomal protein L16
MVKVIRSITWLKYSHEMDGVDETLAREAFRLASAKLPIQTAFVVRQIGS